MWMKIDERNENVLHAYIVPRKNRFLEFNSSTDMYGNGPIQVRNDFYVNSKLEKPLDRSTNNIDIYNNIRKMNKVKWIMNHNLYDHSIQV